MIQFILSTLIAGACAFNWAITIPTAGVFNLFLVGASGWGLAAHRQWKLWRIEVGATSNAPDISEVVLPDPGPGPFGFGAPNKSEEQQ